MGMKTRKARLRRAIGALEHWCRRHRHLSIKEQHASLVRRINGHFNYFGVNGNCASLSSLCYQARRIWLRWLRRRGQRGKRLTWERFKAYLEVFPFPAPTVRVRIWAPTS